MKPHPEKKLIARMLVMFAGVAFAATACASEGPTARPTGRNCSLATPPADSGETTGHGFFLQVFPRTVSIDAGYTGCQAVFVTTKDQPATLAWLMEVVDGDPVRLWSSDKSMGAALSCRFRQGALVAGDPEICKEHPVGLIPSMPAGCALKKKDRANCEYDDE